MRLRTFERVVIGLLVLLVLLLATRRALPPGWSVAGAIGVSLRAPDRSAAK
jgi:hypothetical protein